MPQNRVCYLNGSYRDSLTTQVTQSVISTYSMKAPAGKKCVTLIRRCGMGLDLEEN